MLNTGTLIIDETLKEDVREKIVDRISEDLEKLKEEISEREPIIQKRRNFYQGDQSKYTNVVGLTNKMQSGHILAVFNYVMKFVQKLKQVLTNSIPKIKIVPEDEGDEVETIRAEMVEKTIRKILRDNKFWNVIFKRCGMTQIRDGDFSLDCKVIEDSVDGRHIEINPTEDLLKLMVWWDDASGSSFSATAFRDLWTLSKIKREFGIDADPFSEASSTESKGDHLKNQYGLFATGTPSSKTTPSGVTTLPKAEVVDYWGYEVIKNEIKVLNIIFVNREVKQFLVTDYKKIPRFIGHSFDNAGSPWSTSFIDPLMDIQVELNDRTSEEGDLIRIGAHMKFLVVNMPDFDPDSVKPGSGQVIFIEGEGADFRPLINNMTPFPSEAYLSKILDHLFNIGLPKIALAAGTAPYTGRVASIVYQPIIDIISELRIQWETVLEDLIKTIQQYMIDYFPETHSFMREHIETDIETGISYDGDPIIREVEFDWENVLPLSRSDKVVDASTLRDRHAISLYTYLEQAGFKDPASEIKRLKKESNDKELMTIMEKFTQYSIGVIKAQLDAQRLMSTAQEEQAGTNAAQMESAIPPGTPPANTPILHNDQNSGRRGIPASTGTPTGQTASSKGAIAQKSQNINAVAGV